MEIGDEHMANLVDALEVETTHRLGNKLGGGSAGCGFINFLGVDLSLTLSKTVWLS